MNIKLLLKLILLSILMLSFGYGVSETRIQERYFNKKDIMESHGSFDERLNMAEERISVVEDSTKSGRFSDR